jgi:hypothetical protein
MLALLPMVALLAAEAPDTPPTWELRPFLLATARRQDSVQIDDPAAGQANLPSSSGGTALGSSIGLELSWHLTPALALEATFNPDFGDAEPDELAFNLGPAETFYPEKRLFFSAGADMFSTMSTMVHTLRIGAVPRVQAIRQGRGAQGGNEYLLEAPTPTHVWAASKLIGRLGDRWNIGVMEVLTGRNSVAVIDGGGNEALRTLEPPTLWSVLRARFSLADDAYLGALVGLVDRFESPAAWPLVPGAPNQASCPLSASAIGRNWRWEGRTDDGAVPVAAGSRCFDDAATGGLDWHWRSKDGAWASNGSLVGSVLTAGPPRHLVEGAIINPGDLGTSAQWYAGKETGDHWVADTWGGFTSPSYDNNDLGYQDRGREFWAGIEGEWRTFVRHGAFEETHLHLEVSGSRTWEGLRLRAAGPRLTVSGKFTNAWKYAVEFHASPTWFDDRDIGHGAAYERPGVRLGNDVQLETDAARRVAFILHLRPEWMTNGVVMVVANLDAVVRPTPRFTIDLSSGVTRSPGERRYIDHTATGEYEFGTLTAKGLSSMLRVTSQLTEHLVVQAYAQLFLAAGHYGDFSAAAPPAGQPRPVIHPADLRAAGPPAIDPDFDEAALNVKVNLRWEVRRGMHLQLVYARTQFPELTIPGGNPSSLDLGGLRRAYASQELLLKLMQSWR